MTATQDLSFLALITNASLLVQLVMALLLAVSLISWTYRSEERRVGKECRL